MIFTPAEQKQRLLNKIASLTLRVERLRSTGGENAMLMADGLEANVDAYKQQVYELNLAVGATFEGYSEDGLAIYKGVNL